MGNIQNLGRRVSVLERKRGGNGALIEWPDGNGGTMTCTTAEFRALLDELQKAGRPKPAGAFAQQTLPPNT